MLVLKKEDRVILRGEICLYPEENQIILIVVMVVIITLDMVLLDLATDTHLATLDMDNQVMVILVNAKLRFQNIDNFFTQEILEICLKIS